MAALLYNGVQYGKEERYSSNSGSQGDNLVGNFLQRGLGLPLPAAHRDAHSIRIRDSPDWGSKESSIASVKFTPALAKVSKNDALAAPFWQDMHPNMSMKAWQRTPWLSCTALAPNCW